ncbi:MAG: helix-turn-helix domain-containing protein [Micromonosporaceae bacterium]|nr:helix-turn-helix domain-containing protein [Micromonosporaceae bacterium]
MTQPGRGISAEEAATRLGVKPATLYAYVSRGVLRRHRAPGGRSRFDPVEIDQLARRGRPRRPRGASELVIESAVTALGDDRPYYRGRDALELATRWQLEQVAGWLWTGEAGPAPPAVWRSLPAAVAAGRAAQASLPADVLPLERLQVITPALAATDSLRHTFEPSAVVAIGQHLIAGLVDCLPGSTPDPAAGSIAHRLAGKLAATPVETGLPVEPGLPVQPGLVDVLRAALVVLADHELAASTLAVRVAASVRADPYAAVMVGLGAMGGALHGGASLAAEAMVAQAQDPDHGRQLIGQRLRRGERVPGLGHVVYRHEDGRGRLLLDLLRAAAPGHARLAVVDAMLDEVAQRRLPALNVDFGLAALTQVAGMVPGAGEAIFAVARTVGWLAHALEEYARPTRLRPRATYLGPPAE